MGALAGDRGPVTKAAVMQLPVVNSQPDRRCGPTGPSGLVENEPKPRAHMCCVTWEQPGAREVGVVPQEFPLEVSPGLWRPELQLEREAALGAVERVRQGRLFPCLWLIWVPRPVLYRDPWTPPEGTPEF